MQLKHQVVILILLLTGCLLADWRVTFDGDARLIMSDGQKPHSGMNIAGLLVRKSFADQKGDRVTFTGLLEAEDDFDEVSLHEFFIRYKGPMGRWNVNLGRYTLPYGLLSSFSSRKYLYDTVDHHTIGIHVDSGIMLNGVNQWYDWAFSWTQGYGGHHTPDWPGHGLLMGRLGFVVGDSGDLSYGFSALSGRTAMHHDPDMTIKRKMLGLDATLYWGLSLNRLEISFGKINDQKITTAFWMSDYAILPKMDLTISGNQLWSKAGDSGELFAGISYRLPYITLRGGYLHPLQGDSNESISLQIYYIFSRMY